MTARTAVFVLSVWLLWGCQGSASGELPAGSTDSPAPPAPSAEPVTEPAPPPLVETEQESEDVPVSLTPKGVRGVPLTLIISNQSSSTPRIDLTVSIDDHVVLSREIIMSDMGHSFATKVVHLTKGAHRIDVHSKSGKAQLNETFKLVAARWATLDYWHEDVVREGKAPTRSFAFRMHDEPVLIH